MSKPKKVKLTIENDIVMSPTTTIKDVRDTLWRCRDFELSHLWQRSIFLSAFLILCFTGYATVLQKISEAYSFCFDSYNLAAFGICIFGIMFSCLWIMMAKGSKAWYEIYENSILCMEGNSEYSTKESVGIAGFNHTRIVEEYCIQKKKENMRTGNSDDKPYECMLNNCLFSAKGGAYSPSKLNVGIGQITLLFWGIACLSHAILVFSPDLLTCSSLKYLIFSIGVCALTYFLVRLLVKPIFRSSVLGNYESERGNLIKKYINKFTPIKRNKLPSSIKSYLCNKYVGAECKDAIIKGVTIKGAPIKEAFVAEKTEGKVFKVVITTKDGKEVTALLNEKGEAVKE